MNKSFAVAIEVSEPPAIVFERLKSVSKWWGGSDLSGSTAELGDEFTITHGDAHYSKQKIVAVVPNEKIIWLVTESRLNWLEKDPSEWTSTQMIFEIAPNAGSTRLQFTHDGLTPDKESYARCAEGWTVVVTEWLFEFITRSQPHF